MSRGRDKDLRKAQHQHCLAKEEGTGSNWELAGSSSRKQEKEAATEQREQLEQGTGRIKIKWYVHLKEGQVPMKSGSNNCYSACLLVQQALCKFLAVK